MTIGKVVADNKQQNGYEFVDDTSYGQVVYYRLKMVDQDEFYSFSPLYAVTMDGHPSVVLYPNPVSESLHLKFDQQLLHTDYRIMDKVVQTGQLKTLNYSLDLKSLNTGVYIIQFKDGNALRFIKY